MSGERVLRGRYKLQALVGQGGAGSVYRAEDLRLPGRLTAVKEILTDPNEADEVKRQAQEQFQREASILARLDHPCLPKVSDYFSHEGRDFLVMDYVDGPNLRELVEQSNADGEALAEERVLGWIAQLIETVAYLHGQSPPVLHRDIKPSNIKLVAGDRIKLVDFGLFKPLDPQDPRTLTVARGIGSLPYTPLEQYAGDTGHTDLRADVFSLGATLYHLLTGRAPATAQERFLQPNALKAPGRLRSNLSPRVESAILSAMALHPEKRPSDMIEFRELLFGSAPVQVNFEDGGAWAAWRSALWENAALIVLVALLTFLASLATWDSLRQGGQFDTLPFDTEFSPAGQDAP